jgi:hypothetical protein
MMIRLKNGKKSERANKQANSKKEKRTTTTTKNTPEKASTTLFFFFFSFSFPYTMGFFFFASYIQHSYDSNCPWFMVLRQNFSFIFTVKICM